MVGNGFSPSLRRDAVRLGAIALAYYCAHELAYWFPDSQRVLAAVWPAGGIALASLLLSKRRLWPAILLTIFATGTSASLLAGRPPSLSVAFMVANIAESLACAWLISRMCGSDLEFLRVKEVVALTIAATAVNACTSVIGAAAAALASGARFSDMWLTWWIADGLGILLITPLLVSWRKYREAIANWQWRWALELALFLAVWCVVARLSFQSSPHVLAPHPYMLVTLLAWPALRLGQRGVTVALMVLAIVVVTSRAVAVGPLPWGLENATDRLLNAQAFLAFLAVTTMLLAASYSEAKAAEQSSREDHARVRALGDNLPNGMVYQVVRESDGSQRFSYVSAAVERLSGVSADSVLRDSSLLYGLIVEEDRPIVAAAEEVSARDMSTFNVVVRSRRVDGEIRWLSLSSSPRRLPDGRILWDGIQTDVTEFRRAEQALRESEERYRILVHNTEMPVVAVSAADSRIVFANDPTAEFLGWPASELIGMRMPEFWCSPEERQRFMDALRQGGRVAAFEARFRSRTGEEKWAKIGAALIAFGGERTVLTVFSDITGLKELQQKLESERSFLKTLVDTIPDMVWLKDPDGVFLACNSVVERYLQLPEREIIGKTDFDFGSAEEAESSRLRDREAIEKGVPTVSHEWCVMREDGRRFLMETIKTPMLDSSGRLIGVMGIGRDITVARKAEALLRERVALQEQLERTAVMLPGVIYSFHLRPDGTSSLPYASAAFEDVWGLAPEAVAHDLSRVWERIHPSDLPGVQKSIEESARYMTEWHHEFRVRHPKKGEIWVEGRSTPVRNADGGITWHGFETDITARKQTEMALAYSAIRRRILVEESKDGIAVLDINGKLRERNRTFADMLGYDSRELDSLAIWDWDCGGSREQILQRLSDLATRPVTYETHYRRKDGSQFDVEVSASGAEFAGEFLIYYVVRDITARRRAEQERDLLQHQLQETRRLESIGVLAGGMAHEFNNLLTVINGNAALIRARLNHNDAAFKEALAIEKAGDRAAGLTRQLLAYGRKRLISPRPLNLNSAIEDGSPIWRRALRPDIEVHTELAGRLRQVTADPEQLAEAVLHLVRNAADAMPEGGRLILKTSNVDVDEQMAAEQREARPGSFVLLTVTDTGVGMDEETKGRIFEPFFTTKERALASGLGLATVYGIVAQHQGWIAVESAPGRGSTFSIYLPVSETVNVPEKNGMPTILIVDDHDDVRRLTLSVLSMQGYTMLEASKGADAITLARGQSRAIDLLVTGVLMPGMAGPQLAERLRISNPSLKVLYMSAYPEEVRDAPFIQKPYLPASLVARVREILAT